MPYATDGELNVCYNMLDRHCEPTPSNPHPGDRPCLYHVSTMPVSQSPVEILTFETVLKRV